MKLLFSFFFIMIVTHADELQRLDSIVKDIEKLRINYDLSQEELKRCQMDLSDQKQKNDLIIEELADTSYKKSIISLENKIKELNKSIKNKDIEIEKLKNKPFKNKDNQINTTKNLENKINKFPKLKMRAATYRLNQDSSIYAAKNGEEISKWEDKTSFTSTMCVDGWIKITGYFVDKQWKKAEKSMWVEASHATKRD